jgi:hypothetical protein
MKRIAAPLSVSSTNGALTTAVTASALSVWAARKIRWIPVLRMIAPTAAHSAPQRKAKIR